MSEDYNQQNFFKLPNIKYGSTISISHFKDENAFVYVDGHVKKNVMLRSFKIYKQDLNNKTNKQKSRQSIQDTNQDQNINSQNIESLKQIPQEFQPKNENKENQKQNQQLKDKDLNKLKFSNCLFMIFPKLSNSQKLKIVKSYKYEDSDEDEDRTNDEELVNEICQNDDKVVQKKVNKRSSKENNKNNNNDKDGNNEENSDGSEENEESNKPLFFNQDQVEKQRNHLMNEYKANFDTFKKQTNQIVSYNSVIQLLHLNSCKWLSCKAMEAKYEKENFRITLDDYTSDSTMFKILPTFKYQKDGDQSIFANEIVYIARYQDINNKMTFINTSEEVQLLKQPSLDQSQFLQQLQQDTGINIQQKQQQTQNILGISKVKTSVVSTQRLNSQNELVNKQTLVTHNIINLHNDLDKPINKRELNGSQENHANFKINLFQEFYQENSKYLVCGDVVWIHHSETGSQIGVQRKQKGVDKYVFSSLNLYSWLSKENLELKVLSTNKSESFEQYSGNTFGMWLVESEQMNMGGYIQYGKCYRLKHLSSGYFLSVVRISQEEQQVNKKSDNINDYYQLVLKQIPDETTLFEFTCLDTAQMVEKSKYVSLQSFIFVKNYRYNLYVDILSSSIDLNNQIKTDYPTLSYIPEEKQLFRLYMADKNDIFEINYVISCFSYLVKIAIQLQENQDPKKELQLMFILQKKLKSATKVIQKLTSFCNNQAYNISPNQKYGTSNRFRQKLLKEQYYIDILIKILELALQKNELDFWQKFQQQNTKTQSTQNKLISQHSAQSLTLKVRKSEKEYMHFLATKIYFCIQIYSLLQAICNENEINQTYIFDLLPYFQVHCKYIPAAVDCMSNICKQNKQLLQRLNENIQVQFDFQENYFIKDDYSKTVKFLINLYDGSPRKYKESSEFRKIPFTQHEKLNCRPINLLNYFMNLIWDVKAFRKPEYLRFLSNICIYKDKAITVNQENIFKLFKKFSMLKNKSADYIFSEKGDGELVKPQTQYDWNLLIQKLIFYANLSQGRNFLWKQELQGQFRKDSLFKQIWNGDLNDQNEQKLSSCYCKLSMSLYIDHEPLSRSQKPIYCRLYSDILEGKQYQEIYIASIREQISGEIQQYQSLLQNFKSYIEKVYQNIETQIQIFKPVQQSEEQKQKEGENVIKGKNNVENQGPPLDICSSELLLTATEMLDLLLQLDVYEIVKREEDFADILHILLRILQYDKNNLKFMAAMYLQEKNQQNNKQFTDVVQNLTSGFCGITDFFKHLIELVSQSDDNKDENEDGNQGSGMFEFSSIDDNLLFKNPIMKGFSALNNHLESAIHEDSYLIQNEIKLKMKICDVLNKLLSLRQNYLITNSIYYFKEKAEFSDDITEKLKDKFTTNLEQMQGSQQQNNDEKYQNVNDNKNNANQQKDQGAAKQKKVSYNQKAAQNDKSNKNNESKSVVSQTQSTTSSAKNLFSGFGKRNITQYILSPMISIDVAFNRWWNHIFDKGIGILPRIALTGIQEIDKQYSESDDNLMQKYLTTGEPAQPSTSFKEYQANNKSGKIHDLDTLVTISVKKSKNSEKVQPSVSALPSLLCSFLQIHDQELEKRVLNIMMRLFNQRIELVENLAQMQIIFDDDKTILFKFLQEKLLELQKYTEKSEIWFQTLEKNTDVNSEKQKSFIVEENFVYKLYKLIQNINSGLYLQIKIDQKNGQIMFLKDEVDPQKQKIHKFIKIYEPILTLIQEGMDHFSQVMMSDIYTLTSKQILYDLFQASFIYLKNFVKDNPDNQLLIHQFLNVIISHLQFDLGQIELLCEIYKDNGDLITNLDNEMVELMLSLIEHEGRQVRFLNFLITIQKVKSKMIFENQLLVLNSFLPMDGLLEKEFKLTYTDGVKTNSNLQFYFDDVCSLEECDLIQKLAQNGFNDTYLDEPFKYHAQLLKCLLYATLQTNIDNEDIAFLQIDADQFNISVAKLKKSFTFSYCLDILMKEDDFSSVVEENESPESLRKQGFSYFKPHVVDFIKIVHIFSDSTSPEDLVNQEFSYVQKMAQIAQWESQRLLEVQENYLKEGYIDYIYNNLIGLFQAYYEKYLKVKKSDKQQEKQQLQDLQERKDFIALKDFMKISIMKMMKCKKIKKHLGEELASRADFLNRQFLMMKSSSNNMFDDFDNDIDDFMDNYINSDDEQTSQKSSLSQSQKNSENQKLIRKPKDVIQLQGSNNTPRQGGSILKQHQENEVPQKSQFKKKGVNFSNLNEDFQYSQPRQSNAASQDRGKSNTVLSQKEIKQNNELLEFKWNTFVYALNTSEFISKQIEKEVNAFADSILNIEMYVDKEINKQIDPKLDLNLILKKFIKFLQFSLNDKKSKQTTLTLLTVLRSIVEKDKEEMVNRQNQLDKLGATQMVLIVISEYSHLLDGELYINFLYFINTLLKNGNVRVQKTIYEFFINQIKTELIFKKFHHFIKKQIDYVEQEARFKKRQQLQKERKYSSTMQQDDLQEGISQLEDEGAGEDEDSSSSFTHAQDIVILENILEFLKQTVEGHYLEMQNYIRDQFNLRQKHDMISQIADLLKAYYFEGGTKQYYDNMNKCIDTLSELVQGPCIQNQKAVSESKFFEVVIDILDREFKKKQSVDEGKSQFTSKQKSQVGSQRQTRSKALSIAKSTTSSPDEPLENWMVARLQNKCLVLVLSLLEGRQTKGDNNQIKKIARSIQIDTFEKRIVDIYTKFMIMHKGEYTMKGLNTLNIDVNSSEGQEIAKQNKEHGEDYFSLVLQNGFYLYIIFSYIIESGEKLEGNIVTCYKDQMKQSFQQEEKNIISELLTGDNIIGQLFSFAMSFIESGIQTAQMMQQVTAEQIKKIGKSEEDQEAANKKQQQLLQEQFKKNLTKAVKFFEKNTAHIEILRDNKLETIYFILLPYVHRLPKEKKIEFHENIDRSNEKAKVFGLMEQAKYLTEVCIQEEELNKFFSQNRFLALFANYVKLWKDSAFLMTCILNIFILFTFTDAYGNRFEDQHLFMNADFNSRKTQTIIIGLGLAMTCCSMFVVLFFLIKNLPLLIKRAWSKDKKNKLVPEKPPLIIRFVLWIYKLAIVLIDLLQEIEIIYYIAYGVFSIIGTFKHPFFFCFHLSEILIRFPTLKSVIMAVWNPKKQLALTYILYLIFVWFFSLIAFQFFNGEKDLAGQCNEMLYCYLFLIDYTFKANGGIGGYILGRLDSEEKDDHYRWDRLLFDNAFLIIVVIIIVQIVAGIMIDTFSNLREQENEKKEDIEGKCFICGFKSELFDKKAINSNKGGFQYHIKTNHYMWNYVFYISYLYSKDQNEFSGTESYVYDMIENGDSSWFPVNRSSDLDLDEDEDDESKQQMLLEELEKQTQSLSQAAQETIKLLMQQIKN